MNWEQSINVKLPGPAVKLLKLQTSHEWDGTELPSFPVLVNKKKVEKHTLLCVYHKYLKKDSDKKFIDKKDKK